MRFPSHYNFIIYTHIYKSMIWVNVQIIDFSITTEGWTQWPQKKILIHLHIELELVFFLIIYKTSSISIESSQRVSHILNHEFKWNDKFSKTELRMSSQSNITLRIRKSINRHNNTKFVWHVKVRWVRWQQAQASNISVWV